MPKSVKGVMREWKTGELHSGSRKGPAVTSQKQAVAIALSEQRPKAKATKRVKATVPATGNGDMHRGGSINPYGHLAAALRKKGR